MVSTLPGKLHQHIRGELLKLGLRAAKSTIQRYINQVCSPGSSQQTWRPSLGSPSACTGCRQVIQGTGIHNHAREIWAYDILFRAIFVFVIIELGKRRIVHFGVTHHPTDTWLARQFREAAPFGADPRFLIRGNDRNFFASFSRFALGKLLILRRKPMLSASVSWAVFSANVWITSSY